jgi:hypothetical protein
MKKVLFSLLMVVAFTVATTVNAQDAKKGTSATPQKECCEKGTADKKGDCCADKKDAKEKPCCEKKDASENAKSGGKK